MIKKIKKIKHKKYTIHLSKRGHGECLVVIYKKNGLALCFREPGVYEEEEDVIPPKHWKTIKDIDFDLYFFRYRLQLINFDVSKSIYDFELVEYQPTIIKIYHGVYGDEGIISRPHLNKPVYPFTVPLKFNRYLLKSYLMFKRNIEFTYGVNKEKKIHAISIVHKRDNFCYKIGRDMVIGRIKRVLTGDNYSINTMYIYRDDEN